MTNSKLRFHVRTASATLLVMTLLGIAASAQNQSDGALSMQQGPPVLPAAPSAVVPAQVADATPDSRTAQFSTGVLEDIRSREARISPGDVVEVRIFGVPEMSQDLRVSNAGSILLPLIGPTSAQGLTTGELEQKIAAALSNGGFMNDPQVNVSAKELRSAGVSVTGEVGKPGIYPVYGSCQLADMIVAAGGMTPRSGRLITITHRDQPDITTNVEIASTSARPFRDVEVFSGDKVVVAKAGVVYVLGDVARPAGLVMEGDARMTVLQALTLSGGAGKDAALKGARIIRKTSAGVQEVPVPLKDILRAQKLDIELLEGDVLYIPASKSQDYWRNAGAILQAATMVAIFRP